MSRRGKRRAQRRESMAGWQRWREEALEKDLFTPESKGGDQHPPRFLRQMGLWNVAPLEPAALDATSATSGVSAVTQAASFPLLVSLTEENDVANEAEGSAPTLPGKKWPYWAAQEENGDIVFFIRIRKAEAAYWPQERLELTKAAMAALEALRQTFNSKEAVELALGILAQGIENMEEAKLDAALSGKEAATAGAEDTIPSADYGGES